MDTGPARRAADELVEVVDDEGEVVRLAPRSEMRASNLRHRSVAVVVVTSAGCLISLVFLITSPHEQQS